MDPKVEDVFKTSGLPTYTFVEPSVFPRLRVSLRTPGRGVVVEGPSGIGKSTAVVRAFEAEGITDNIQFLSARSPSDRELIELLPRMDHFGTVVIEDFHVLPLALQGQIADLLKLLADASDETSKVVVVGINRAGDSLVKAAPDLAHRLTVLPLGAEADEEKLQELIGLGEKVLNVTIAAGDEAVKEARGSYYLLQMLCQELCLDAGVLERQEDELVVSASLASVKAKVMARHDVRFFEAMRTFARGTRFRPGGRAAYLHVLRWLAESKEWEISLKEEVDKHPKQRASVDQIVDRGYLEELIADNPDIAAVLHYSKDLKSLSVQDPHLAFYLRNVDWNVFAKRCGFTSMEDLTTYDFALSFAGEDRAFAERLYDALTDEYGCTVFFDANEEARILAEDLEVFFGPIYQSESTYVIAVLGPTYGERRWTRFESEQFKERFGEGRVIPVWSTKARPTAFDTTKGIGGRFFDPDGDLALQARQIAAVCEKKLRG